MSADRENRALRDAEDVGIMQRIREGDDAAVAELYDRYASLALALALKILRQQAEAEDVVHDGFVALVERADQFDAGRGTVAAWLVTTIRNLALDRTRRRSRRKQILDEEVKHQPREAVPNPEALTEIEQERVQVRLALDALPAQQRATLEVAFFEGLSYPEIAERDGVPLGTVKSRAARALSALRDALDDLPR